MVKKLSRVENKRKTGLKMLVGEDVDPRDLVGRGAWTEKLHAHSSVLD
jgi:hypothetical protein